MTNPTDKDELREIIDFIFGELKRLSGSPKNSTLRKELENAIEADADQRVKEARIDERNQVALDNYRGQTFSDSTNYMGKFDKFVRNNERRIATLKESKDE